MKKIYITFTVLALFFVFTLSAFAQTALTVGNAEFEQSTGKETVEIPISISGNTGITGLKLKIEYSNGLELKKITKSENGLSNLDMTPSAALTSPCNIMWDGTDDDKTNGEIAVLTMELSKEVSGQYSVNVLVEEAYDFDLKDVSISVSGGNILVKGDKAPVEPEVKPTEPEVKPTEPEVKPTEPEVKPTEPEVKPTKPEDIVEVYLMDFVDVDKKNWFYDSVKYVSQKKLMNGVSEKEFAPNSNLTRAMLVTILYRMENQPECKAADFKDVENGMWYTDSISWAYERGIVNGVGDGKFAPNANITREQIAVILYNYANYKNRAVDKTTALNKFADANDVSTWATDAVKWAVGEGIITGKTESTIVPQGQATRAEAATMLMRYLK